MRQSPRRRARELVLQSLYALEHGKSGPDGAFDSLVREENLGEKNVEFARNLLRLVDENRDWADEKITMLAENWSLERIAAVDRNILRMAIVELERMPDTPVKVVLNESIELAKKFSTGESSRFVNGILDNYVKGMKGERSS